MKIYVFSLAPNPAKVLLYLAEKGLDAIERVPVSLLHGEQNQPEHLARDPFGRVPVLELDDGSFLPESTAIVEYLEELFPDPPLIGATPEARAQVRSRERMVDQGVLIAGARLVHSTRSPLGLPPNPGVAESARSALDRTLAVVDGWLEKTEFVAGPELTIADCTMWAGLRFQRAFELDAHEGFENVARWQRTLDARPSTAQV